jgi:hypothetical protein
MRRVLKVDAGGQYRNNRTDQDSCVAARPGRTPSELPFAASSTFSLYRDMHFPSGRRTAGSKFFVSNPEKTGAPPAKYVLNYRRVPTYDKT